MEHADYVILNNRELNGIFIHVLVPYYYFTGSPQFQKCLELLPLDKIALSQTWLQECDRTGAVAGLAGHIIDVDSGQGPGAARKKPVSPFKTIQFKPVNTGDESCESEEGIPEPSNTSQTSMRTSRTNPLQEILPGDSRRRSQSPSPPPITLLKGRRKYLYTEADRQWFFQYARFKLERNPKLSTVQLMKSVARKVC
jgi:hypothetical protein